MGINKGFSPFFRIAFGSLMAAMLLFQPAAFPQGKGSDPERLIVAERLYRKAIALSEKKPGKGKNLFKEIKDSFSDTPWAERAGLWLDENPILSLKQIKGTGPPGNRIDVAIMGDGFKDSYTDRHRFELLCEELISHFFRCEVHEEYEPCFNFYQVMLASRENRLDYRGHKYNTALNGRKHNDDRHVSVSRDRVRHYLQACPWSDKLAFAVVREDGLGTGGGGVATVSTRLGRVVVHEWGHAFAGLADEYSRDAVTGGSPARGPNLSSSPDPRKAPWAHWFKKFPHKYKAHEGGAGRYKGVWRPTPDGCIMRHAHDFCPICREALVLRIYNYIKPIDDMTPNQEKITVVTGEEKGFLEVYPIVPKTHRLKVEWSVIQGALLESFGKVRPEFGKEKMPGEKIVGKKGTTQKGIRYYVEFQDLISRRKISTGPCRIYARVTDTARVKGEEWVLKDDRNRLTQTVSWDLHVKPRPPKPPPAVDLTVNVVPLISRGSLGGIDCSMDVMNRPKKPMEFHPFEQTFQSGFAFSAFEGIGARDLDGQPLETRPFGDAWVGVASGDRERFSMQWKRMAAGDAAGDVARDGTDGAGPLATGLSGLYVLDSGKLFLTPKSVRLDRINLNLTLPPDWKAAAPWPLLQGVYRIPTPDSMARNLICLGPWEVREALTKHVLIRTAIPSSFGRKGSELNKVLIKMITATAVHFPLEAGRSFLVAALCSGFRWRADRGADSLLLLLPGDYDPLANDREQDLRFRELAACEFVTLFNVQPADEGARQFLNCANRLLALKVVAETQTRGDVYFLRRAAQYLSLVQQRPDREEAIAFAVAFILDRIIMRLAEEGKGLGPFMAGFREQHPGEEGRTLDEILKALSTYGAFDMEPFWKKLMAGPKGPDISSWLEKFGLKIVEGKSGLTLVEAESVRKAD